MSSTRAVKENHHGYFTIAEKPSEKELQEYYASAYYQNAQDNYQQEYSVEERQYIDNKIDQKYQLVNLELPGNNDLSLLDVGCGEGWSISFFAKKGWQVTGLDYSSYGCEKFNPDLLSNVITGDIYQNLKHYINEKRTFDVIILDNVLEHVLDPESLVSNLKSLVKPGGILIVEVPNDFSVIQNYAFEKGMIESRFWIAYPDHISYFNNVGLKNLMEAFGWKTIRLLADYPIDWNLLNPDSNYVRDRSKGRNCHLERIGFENLVSQLPFGQLLAFYESMANLGLGRQITGFFTLSK